jgi:alpha-ketoglutarate-dependent taurine dioxygenase
VIANVGDVTDSVISASESPPVETDPSGRVVVRAAGAAKDWLTANRDALRAAVTSHGAVLVRGLDLRDLDKTIDAYRALSIELLTDRQAFAPRSRYADGVYSSSQWPADQPMCMHHELSYAQQVPGLLALACLRAPAEGGATATADAAAVLAALPAEVVRPFRERGWSLVRSYNGEVGVSLADSFGTDERAGVESYCRANGIEFEWGQQGVLRTRQRGPAVIGHPVTGVDCWFNQIAFLNEWTMAPEIREYLLDVYGPDGLPFTTRFGDGSPIDEGIIETINAGYEAHTVSSPWQVGDLMLIDNIRTAHSTQPYQGDRQIVVAMAEPVRRDA